MALGVVAAAGFGDPEENAGARYSVCVQDGLFASTNFLSEDWPGGVPCHPIDAFPLGTLVFFKLVGGWP